MATDEEVPPSIKAVLLVLGVEVGESVELFVAAAAGMFWAWEGINVAFNAGLIASSEIKKMCQSLPCQYYKVTKKNKVF